MKQGTYTFDANVSKCHKQVLKFFQKKYSEWKIIQNAPVRINDHTLFADCLVNMPHKILIEIHGEQHYSHISYFHKTSADFEHAQELDNLKKMWAEINGFAFIEVDGREKFDEDEFNRRMMRAIFDNLKKED
jgi:hypothetical protein